MKMARLSALRSGRLYPQDIFLLLISVRGWVDPRAIVRPEGICQWKIPVTPSKIVPDTLSKTDQCYGKIPIILVSSYSFIWDPYKENMLSNNQAVSYVVMFTPSGRATQFIFHCDVYETLGSAWWSTQHARFGVVFCTDCRERRFW
jgi:hypothetical protein